SYDGSAKAATATTNPTGLSTAITYNGSATAPTAAGTYTVVATISDANYSGSASGSMVISKATPTVNWATPAPVYLGSALTSAQLNATASTAGSFVYTPAAGTVLNTAGTLTLSVAFTPNDTANYNNASATVSITVNNRQNPVITWAAPAAITYGTALSAAQLNATANVPGTFTYTPAAGTVLNAGTQTLSLVFTPNDTAVYNSATASVSITVNKATATATLSNLSQTYDGSAKAATVVTSPAGLSVNVTYNGSTVAPTVAGTYAVIATINDSNYSGSATGSMVISKATPTVSWATPEAVYIGTALTSTQLNATANMPGTFTYVPAAGTVMNTAGSEILAVAFSPSDADNYNIATATVSIIVNNRQNPVITWPAPAAISYGTALSATQLNATANVPGSFVYTPAAGTVLNAGTQILSLVFTPNDATTFNSATASVSITVNKAVPVISWATPTAVDFGTILSTSQLNASANVPGTFVYIPAAGTVLNTAGVRVLSTNFTPADTVNYANAIASVSITVGPAPNQAPSLSAIPNITITAPADFSHQVAANDPENQVLTYSLTGNPSGMSISNTGFINWNSSIAGTYAITVTVSDPGKLSASRSFTLTVNNAPALQAPVITSSPVTEAYDDGYYYYALAASDPNNDKLSYALTTKPSGMTINATTGLVYWRPSDKGTYYVTVKVSDTTGLSVTQSFKVTVLSRPPNSSPKIISTPVKNATVGILYNYDVNASDSNGDVLYYRLKSAPTGVSIDLYTGVISWIPVQSQTGIAYITVEVVDNKGGKSTQGYICTVSAPGTTINNPPEIISAPNTSAYRNVSYTYAVKAADPDNDVLKYELMKKPFGMTIDSSTGLISWIPSSTGIYSVTVKVTDSNGAYTTQGFNIIVRYFSSYGASSIH
ncbi:MAG: MBG domain-containing protein, partial [Deltaproteobacteria bacterium]|nr:MBG domain-containing protein [Deltaproteobacteria bacterium]